MHETDVSLPVVGVVSDVTERAVMCADGTIAQLPPMDENAAEEPTTRCDWVRPMCGPHYLAERHVITTEWQRVEEQR